MRPSSSASARPGMTLTLLPAWTTVGLAVLRSTALSRRATPGSRTPRCRTRLDQREGAAAAAGRPGRPGPGARSGPPRNLPRLGRGVQGSRAPPDSGPGTPTAGPRRCRRGGCCRARSPRWPPPAARRCPSRPPGPGRRAARPGRRWPRRPPRGRGRPEPCPGGGRPARRCPRRSRASSSATTASLSSRRRGTPRRASSSTVATLMATICFMSTAPRPQSTPSWTSPGERRVAASASASAATTSTWPLSSSGARPRLRRREGDHGWPGAGPATAPPARPRPPEGVGQELRPPRPRCRARVLVVSKRTQRGQQLHHRLCPRCSQSTWLQRRVHGVPPVGWLADGSVECPP